MKLSDAIERLKQEFPGRHASISYTASIFQTGTAEATVELYVSGNPPTMVEGRDLEDCITQARRLLNPPLVKPENVDIER